MSIIRRTLIFLLLTLPVVYLPAQDKTTDSLLSITKKGTPRQKIEAYNALASMVVYDDPEASKNYARKSVSLSEQSSYQQGLGDAYTRIGIACDVSGQYDSSIYFYEAALSIYNKMNNLKGRGSALNNIGLIYWNMADYDKALRYFFDALKDFETIKNDTYTANALNNIGLVYDDTKKFNQALVYHHKAREVYEKMGDPYLKGAVYNNLGNSYSNLSRMDSAGYYYRKAIDMHLLAKDDYGLSIAYSGYATLLQSTGNIDEALAYYTKSLPLKEKINEMSGQSTILINMAEIYKSKKNAALELAYLEKAKTIAEKNNLRKDLISIYQKLSLHYEQSDLPLSYRYFKKYNEVKDSVFNETSNRQITELNTKYETGKKELKLKEQDLLIARNKFLIWGITASVMLLAFIGFFYYKKNQFKHAAKLQAEIMKQQDLATKSIIAAEENERKRIAADLHDGVGQMMSAAKMNLSVFESELPFSNELQKHSFENVISMVDECCREIRSVSHQMMPNALLKSGLANAVKEFLGKIDNRVIRVSLHAEGLNERIDSNTETVLYRVIQECVNNVLKHAGANLLDISLIRDTDGISVTIEDNGKGFNSASLQKYEGLGLKNIISRVNFLKGSIEIDSTPGKGTLIAIHIPAV